MSRAGRWSAGMVWRRYAVGMTNHAARGLLLLGFPILAMATGGCASSAAPKVSIAGAQLAERTSEGVAMQFTLNAENTNDVGLPLRTVRYTLELDGKQVFSGTRSAEATLRRLGTQQIVLPAVIANLPETAATRTTGRVPYRISGTMTYIAPGQIAEILFDSGVRVPSTDFSGTGEIDLGG